LIQKPGFFVLVTLPSATISFAAGEKKDMEQLICGVLLVESCDVYFYQLGNTIGIDNIAKYATMLGLGEKNRD